MGKYALRFIPFQVVCSNLQVHSTFVHASVYSSPNVHNAVLFMNCVPEPSVPIAERRIILSGSFNPLHEGHFKLLEVATRYSDFFLLQLFILPPFPSFSSVFYFPGFLWESSTSGVAAAAHAGLLISLPFPLCASLCLSIYSDIVDNGDTFCYRVDFSDTVCIITNICSPIFAFFLLGLQG